MASGGSDRLSCVKTLAENSKDVFLETSEVILRIIRNIIKDPANPKYRRLRVSTTVFMDKLLPVNGAMDCLLELGFQEDGDFFSMPENLPTGLLHMMKDQLEMQQRVSTMDTSVKTEADKGSKPEAAGTNSPEMSPSPGPPPTLSSIFADTVKGVPSHHPILMAQTRFFQKIESSLQMALSYEDPQLQAQAISCIPLTQLEERAETRWANVSTGAGRPGVGLRDVLLLELLAWFKEDFFQWVDAPRCDSCGGKTHIVGTVEPTPAEQLWRAWTVESYLCGSCEQLTRFPRYNHAGMLLETRRGRCGEWANCFTLCCRAVGFDVRYVLDWTDHVWTEVYSVAQGRWMHCDPGENVCDKPLLYEAGWGKKLTYVLAFSHDYIQDVTWRYSARHEDVLSRRVEVSENWLLLTILRLRQRLMLNLPKRRVEELNQRLVIELVELMSVKSVSDEELTGRVSGSLDWRTLRGETGDKGAAVAVPHEVVTIRPTEEEVAERQVHLRYTSAIDKYIRGGDGEHVVSGWAKLVHEVTNVMHKEERDWKMAYLARKEGTDSASISWKFDFTDSGLVVDVVDVTAENSLFENGQVVWRVSSEQQSSFLPPGGARTVINDLEGSRVLTLSAHLRGGEGDCAWQHTQLFRQSLDDSHLYPFNIIIKLKEEK